MRGNDGGELTRKSLNMQPSPYLEHEIARLIRTGFSFRIPLIVDQAEVVVEGRARFGAISVVEYVVNIEHDLLRLGPTGHALKVGPSIADSDRKLLCADRAEGGGPAGFGDQNLPRGILRPDLVVGGFERIEAGLRSDPDRLVGAIRIPPVPDRVDVDAYEIDEV